VKLLTHFTEAWGMASESEEVWLGMARKSKRIAMNEAIRQGQAKIAEGLKTGQMRSDGPSAHNEKKGQLSPENKLRSSFEVGPAFSRSKDTSTMGRFLSSNTKLVLLMAVVAIVMIIALSATLTGRRPAEVNDQSGDSRAASEPRVEDTLDVDEGGPEQGPQPDESEATAKTEEDKPDELEAVVVPPVVSTGDNVIVIYTIDPARKDLLIPVVKFFKAKGIETEIINISGNSGLVTKAGFKQNPASRGTDGYKLFQQIKQLGSVYVEQTQDTQFGQPPFQDIYGYKRQ